MPVMCLPSSSSLALIRPSVVRVALSSERVALSSARMRRRPFSFGVLVGGIFRFLSAEGRRLEQ